MATAGDVAKFTYNTYDVVAVGTASISIQRPALDASALNSASATYIGGVYSATASLDLFFDLDEASNKALVDDLVGTTPVSRSVLLTLETGETIGGTAFVTGFDVTAQVGSVTRATIGLQFTGAITVTHTA